MCEFLSMLTCSWQGERKITLGGGREGGARAFVMLPEGGICVRVCDVNLNVNGVRIMFRFLVTGCYDGR